MPNQTGAVALTVKVDGTEIQSGQWSQLTVDRDLNQPDMATLIVNNSDHGFSDKFKPGQSVDVSIKDTGEKLFVGEVVGVEPIFRGKGESKMIMRCFNKLHRMLRGRSSKTYNDKTDKQIITEVLGKYGLSIDYKGPEIQNKVVYQHNQNDLEFVRTRAARLGLNVWCSDKTVYVKEPELDKESGTKYSLGKGIDQANQILSFSPRMSSAPVVKKVTVKGWDEEKKELIEHTEEVQGSKLGDSASAPASQDQGEAETFTVDHPVRSKEEAKALAKAKLTELSLGFMSAELEVLGTGKIEPGSVMQVTVNTGGSNSFNGKYFVAGVSHSYTPDTKSGGGFTTTARLQRDASGGAPEKG